MRYSWFILLLVPMLSLAQQIDTTVQYGPDTVMYALDGKATGIDAYYMNTTVQYTGYAQYYNCPQSITVNGFCFYAWVENTGMTAEVICSIHEPLSDSLPGALIASDTITVTDNYTVDLEGIRYCADFDIPVLQGQPYVLSVRTDSPLDLNIISNDAADNNGAGEALSFYYWSGTNPGWTHNEEFFSWDIDWVLCPIVEYEVAVQAFFDQDTLCQADTLNVNATTPDIWSDRMYNRSAFDGDEWQDVSWLISQNPPFLGYSVSAPIQQHGDVPIGLYVEFNGWRNTTMFPFTANIHSEPLPVAGFDLIAGQLEVQFFDTAMYADSVLWDFGDGSMISNEIDPIHTYPGQGWYTVQQIAFNSCGVDTASMDIQLMTTGLEGSEKVTFKVFPNPTSGQLNIELDEIEGDVELELVDIAGRVCYRTVMRTSPLLLELDASVKAGIYHLRILKADEVLSSPVQIVR